MLMEVRQNSELLLFHFYFSRDRIQTWALIKCTRSSNHTSNLLLYSKHLCTNLHFLIKCSNCSKSLLFKHSLQGIWNHIVESHLKHFHVCFAACEYKERPRFVNVCAGWPLSITNIVMLFEATKMFIILAFPFNKLQSLPTTNAYTPVQHVVIAGLKDRGLTLDLDEKHMPFPFNLQSCVLFPVIIPDHCLHSKNSYCHCL